MKITEYIAFTLTDILQDFYEREEVKTAPNALEEQRKRVLALVPQKQYPIVLK